MSKKQFEIAIHNLKLLYNTEGQCLHRDQFQTLLGTALEEPKEIIELLIKHDLIETESDPNIYYLTTETYHFIEQGDIDFHLWYLMDLGDYDDRYEDDKPRDRKLNYRQIEPEEEPKKTPFLSRLPRIVMAAAFVTILGLLYNFSPFSLRDKKKEVPPNALDGLQKLIIDEVGDTIQIH